LFVVVKQPPTSHPFSSSLYEITGSSSPPWTPQLKYRKIA
jgi:hypothetical protein